MPLHARCCVVDGGGLSLNSAHLHNGLSSWAGTGPLTLD